MRRTSFILSLFSWYALIPFTDASSAKGRSAAGIYNLNSCCSNIDDDDGCAHFNNHEELRVAVTDYLNNGCSDKKKCENAVVEKHGWPIGSWCVSRVTRMDFMFQNFRSFNDDISLWDVSSVTDMESMFEGASSFNQDLSSWNVTSVSNMVNMFQEASDFDGDLKLWNTSSVTNMEGMFSDALSFNQDLSSWKTSKVTNMDRMFQFAESFNQDLSRWDVSSVKSMSGMFEGASAFNQDLCRWGTKLPLQVSIDGMFKRSGCLDSNDPILQGSGPFCAVTCTVVVDVDESADADADSDSDSGDEDVDSDSSNDADEDNGSIGAPVVDEATPVPTNVHFSNEGDIEGISEHTMDNATIEDTDDNHVHWEDFDMLLNPTTIEEKCFYSKESQRVGAALPCNCADPTKPLAKTGVFADQWKRHHGDMVSVANHSKSNLDVVFLGDSIIEQFSGTAGMGVEALEGRKAAFDRRFSKKAGGRLDGKAFGTAGDVGPNLLWHIQNGLIDNLKPKVWFILIGSNDLFTTRCTEDFVVASIMNVVKLVSEKSPESLVFVHGIFPRLDNPKTENTTVLGEIWRRGQRANNKLRKFCRNDDSFYYLHGGDLMLERSNVTGLLDIDPKMIGDGVHPTHEGYEKWGDFVVEELQQILADGVEPDGDESEVADVDSIDEIESSEDEDSVEDSDKSEVADADTTDENDSSGDEESVEDSDESEVADVDLIDESESSEDEDSAEDSDESEVADADTTDEHESSDDEDSVEDSDESEVADADTTDEHESSDDEDSDKTEVANAGTTDENERSEDEGSEEDSGESQVADAVSSDENESSDDQDSDKTEIVNAGTTDENESSEDEDSDEDSDDEGDADMSSEDKDGDNDRIKEDGADGGQAGKSEGLEVKTDEIEDVVNKDATKPSSFGNATLWPPDKMVVGFAIVFVLLLLCVYQVCQICRRWCCCQSRSNNQGQYRQVANQYSGTRYKDNSDDDESTGSEGDIV